MSNENNTAAAAGAAATQPLTPEEMIQIVRDMASRAPVIEPASSVTRAQQSRLARVQQELVEASLAAINASSEVQSALGRTDVDVRTEDADATHWAVAIETMRQFVNDLAMSNSHRRQRVGLTALQTLQICRSLAREPRYARTLAPHVDAMRRVVAKYRAKRQNKPETPAPQQLAA